MTNLTIVLAGIFYCILLRDFDKSKNVQRSSCDEPSKAGGLRRKGSRGMCKKHFYLFKFGKFAPLHEIISLTDGIFSPIDGIIAPTCF